MFSERRGRRSLHPNIQQIDKPKFSHHLDCGERIATTSLRTGLAMTCKVRKTQQLPHYHVIARAIARGNPFPAMQGIALAVRPI